MTNGSSSDNIFNLSRGNLVNFVLQNENTSNVTNDSKPLYCIENITSLFDEYENVMDQQNLSLAIMMGDGPTKCDNTSDPNNA